MELYRVSLYVLFIVVSSDTTLYDRILLLPEFPSPIPTTDLTKTYTIPFEHARDESQ